MFSQLQSIEHVQHDAGILVPGSDSVLLQSSQTLLMTIYHSEAFYNLKPLSQARAGEVWRKATIYSDRACGAEQPHTSGEFCKTESAFVHHHFAIYVDSRVLDDTINVCLAIPFSICLAR
jgi:hypothetical protein